MAVFIQTLNGGNITIGSSSPAIDPQKTRFTLSNGTVEEYDISGELSSSWMGNNGFMDYDIFEWTKSITNVDVGNTVTEIGTDTFTNSSIQTITIPNSVLRLGTAFYDCGSLQTVVIGNGIAKIQQQTFHGCPNLMNVTFQGKTRQQVQDIEDDYNDKQYPWELSSGCVIHCSDGNITVP